MTEYDYSEDCRDIIDPETDAKLIEAAERAATCEDREISFFGNEWVRNLSHHIWGVALPGDVHIGDSLIPFVRYWYELMKDRLFEKDGTYLSFGNVWAIFLSGSSSGIDSIFHTLKKAIERAESATYDIPELHWCDDQNIHLLARVCHELAGPKKTFYLSSYEAGEILCRNHTRASIVFLMLQEREIIECIGSDDTKRIWQLEYIGKPVVERTKP